MQNNSIMLQGKVTSNFEFSHEFQGEKFYTFKVLSVRPQGVSDELPVMVSENMLDISVDLTDSKIAVSGQIRTHNQFVNRKNKLLVYIFVKKIIDIEENDFNTVEIVGYICKEPNFRKTPREIEIADLILVVNRRYKMTDYLPCIAWGRNARYAQELEVGTKVKAVGGLRSRTYIKDGNACVAYEFSIAKLEEMEGANDNKRTNIASFIEA